jgi:hypothetical protein
LTDLLVNFRRIVHRGLVNYSGELWYREGLPSDVFRRLVVRKENETPLDRFSGDYEELMTYANFRDLADIIVGNEVLRDRLTILEPRDGVSLLDRLHELEEIRRTISTGGKAGGDVGDRLQKYFDEFRSAIKGRKPGPKPTSPRTKTPEPKPPVEKTAEEETLESIFEPDDPPAAAPATPPRPGRLVVKVSSSGLRDAAEGQSAETTPQGEPPRSSVASEVGSMETPVTDVSTGTPRAEEAEKGLVEEAEGLELALREDDTSAILKALHIEVTEIADGMLRRDPKHGHVVWEQVRRRGWFEANREEFALDPLLGFYELADGFLDAFASGAKSSELKAMLADAGFSKMLLGLREMFLASRAKV